MVPCNISGKGAPVSYKTLSRCAFIVIACAVLVTGTATTVKQRRTHGRAAGGRPKAFREEAEKAGITFRMNFSGRRTGRGITRSTCTTTAKGLAIGDYRRRWPAMTSTSATGARTPLYRNKGDGTFDDVTEKAGVAVGDQVCVAATWADTRNIGLQDLFVTSTALAIYLLQQWRRHLHRRHQGSRDWPRRNSPPFADSGILRR